MKPSAISEKRLTDVSTSVGHTVPRSTSSDQPSTSTADKLKEFEFTEVKKKKRDRNKAFAKGSSSESSPEIISKKPCSSPPDTSPSLQSEVQSADSKTNMDDLSTKLEQMQTASNEQFEKLSKLIKDATVSYTNGLEAVKRELADYKSTIELRLRGLEAKANEDSKRNEDTKQEMKSIIDVKFKLLDEKVNSISLVGDPGSSSVVKSLQHRIEGLEKESKKLNLVIKGLNSSAASARVDVEELFSKAFNLPNKISDARFVFLRKSNSSMIVVHMDSWESKISILREKKNLKKSEVWKDVFIEPELTAKEKEIANKIRALANVQRKDGKTVRSGLTWMTVGEEDFVWNEAKGSLVKSSKSRNYRTDVSPDHHKDRARYSDVVQSGSSPKNV